MCYLGRVVIECDKSEVLAIVYSLGLNKRKTIDIYKQKKTNKIKILSTLSEFKTKSYIVIEIESPVSVKNMLENILQKVAKLKNTEISINEINLSRSHNAL